MATTTDIFGFQKPNEKDSNTWGHLIAMNFDMIDRFLAAQRDDIARLRAANDHLRDRIAKLETATDQKVQLS